MHEWDDYATHEFSTSLIGIIQSVGHRLAFSCLEKWVATLKPLYTIGGGMAWKHSSIWSNSHMYK